MAAIADNDIVLVKVYCEAPPQLGLNIGHFIVSDLVPTVNDAELPELLDVVVRPLYVNALCQKAKYRGLSTQVIPRTGPPKETYYTAGGSTDGLGGAALLPQQSSLQIILRTGVAGRANRGRKWIPFASEEDNDNALGTPNGAYQALAGLIGAWWSNPTAYIAALGTFELHPVLDGEQPVSVADYRIITSQVVGQKWSQQKRRSLVHRPDLVPPQFLP